MLFCAILIIIAPVFLSTLTGKITASDWTYRHTQWISRYLHGDFTPAVEYPPLFHVMLAPFVAINFPMVWFQVIFIALSTGGILYYVWKQEGEKTLLYTSMLLASSIAYVSFAGSLMPQALDYFLFPIILLFYFQKKYIPVILGLIAFFFMHLTGAVFIFILLIHSILTRRKKFAVSFLILGLIILPFFLHYINPDAVANRTIDPYVWDFEAQAEWESQYLKFPEFFIFSGFMMWALIPFALKKMYDEWFRESFKLSDTQLLYIIWTLSLIPIAIFGLGWWRMTTYIVVPLSLLVASVLGNELQKF